MEKRGLARELEGEINSPDNEKKGRKKSREI